MGVDIVEVLRALQDALHRLDAALLLPVATLRHHHLYAGIGLDGIHKSAMTLQGWRRAFEACDFDDTALAVQLLGDERTHRLAYQIVVAADEGSILVRVGLAVVEYHGDALVVGSLYGLGYRAQLVGRHHQQVDALVDKLVDLLVLQDIVVVRRGELHDDRVIEKLAHLELVVQLVAPDVFRALRHADDKRSGLAGAGCEQHHAGNDQQVDGDEILLHVQKGISI